MTEQGMPEVTKTAEHEWLQRLVGEWTFEHEAEMEPGQPPVKLRGTEVVRSLGGIWIVCEGDGELPGGEIGQTVMSLGFDPARELFQGTFIGSMMTHLWIYQGSLQENRLVLDTKGPSFTEEGKTARYQDIIEVKGDDHRLLHSQFLNEEGEWHSFMTANYWRR